MRSFARSIIILIFLNCRVFFWIQTSNYDGGAWLDNSTFFEVRHEYESKSSWYALNQNVMSRNFHTRLLRGTREAPQKTEDVAAYRGWTLTHSLQAAPGQLFAIRGFSDGFATGPMELISIEPGSKKIETLFKAGPEQELYSARLSFDGSRLALAYGDRRTEKMVVLFYSTANKEQLAKVTADWQGPLASPAMAWSKGGDRLYLQRQKDVLQLEPSTQQVAKALSFPRCFYSAQSNISKDGTMFYRSQEEGQLEFRSVEDWIAPDEVPYTGSMDQIEAGCP